VPTRLMPFSTFLLIWICLHPVVALAQQQAAPQGSQPATAPTPATQEAEENRQKEAEETKRLTELYLRNQNVFLRKNEVMIELDTFYNRNSQQNLIPVTGGVALVQTTRRFVDNTIIARYGFLTDGLEVDLIAPVFVHAEVENNFGTETTTQEENGFGDLAAAIRYQVWYERGNRPSLVLDVEGKSRTGGNGLLGTGTWNAGGGVTLIKSIDPVVFFGRIGYTYNFASQSRDLGNIFEYRLGMGFSLNDRVSFNVQFTGAYIGASTFPSTSTSGATATAIGITPIPVSTQSQEIMNLVFTVTVMVTKKLFIEPLVAVGLTENSFTIVGVRIPFRF
jgi:hypothetical protein